MDPIRERNFVDRVALVFEHAGIPPISGRILGRLLICDPPEQSSAELADYLLASKGAVSTATRMLMEIGVIEKIRRRGSRASWFRAKRGAWGEMLHAEITRVRMLRQLADEGLALMSEAPPERLERLQEFRDFNAFFETELPELVTRWDARNRNQP